MTMKDTIETLGKKKQNVNDAYRLFQLMKSIESAVAAVKRLLRKL